MILKVDWRASLNEQLDHLWQTSKGRHLYGGISGMVSGLNIGPGCNEQLGEISMAGMDGQVQGCVIGIALIISIFSIYVCPSLNQSLSYI